MALSVPSRFACLKIEDDDFRPQTKSKEKKKVDQKTNNKKQPEKNGMIKKVPKKEKKKKEKSEQWEEWKEKDSELVKETYEQDLQEALMNSMLDAEKSKKQVKHVKEEDKKNPDIPNLKKKKSKTMTLEQFNNMTTDKPVEKATNGNNGALDECVSDEHFFDRVKSETKEELNKESKKELNKENKETKKVRKSFNNETITIAQYQAKLEAQQQENLVLKTELEKAKKEIFAVKTRNKTLCGILAHGEMKDKADVLMELDRLSRVRDELTEEVTRLHALLEQERSKVGALSAEPHNKHNKDKNKKKNSMENTQ